MAGNGAYVEISEDLQWLQTRCEETQRVVKSALNLRNLRKGWHHIAITCNNKHADCEGEITFRIDGK